MGNLAGRRSPARSPPGPRSEETRVVGPTRFRVARVHTPGVLDTPEIPEGFELRPATVHDAESIANVTNACMLAELGRPWTTPERALTDLTAPGIDLANHLLLSRTDGAPVGYLEVTAAGEPLDEVGVLAFVDPSFWGRGFSALLLEVAESRADAIVSGAGVSGPVAFLAARLQSNEPAGRLFASRGYTPIRTFHMMRIELADPPPSPSIPDGIRIRTFERDRDARSVYDAMMEAFADHWGSDPTTFEQWVHGEIDGEATFDPSLWFVAVDGDEVAGVALSAASSPRSPDTAVVAELAVRRPWRRRGLGLALLLTAFGAFAERRIPAAELGVDSENPTGATRLYARAGMKPAYAWEWWRKDLTGS